MLAAIALKPAIENLVYARRRVKRGETLYQAGGRSNAAYAIRSGFFKTSLPDAEGREQVTGFFMGGERAEQRLATFLINLSRRFVRRGYASSDFLLRMTREELGSHLGLKLETVSRLFSRFHRDGLIDVDQKHVRILDIRGLERVLGERS